MCTPYPANALPVHAMRPEKPRLFCQVCKENTVAVGPDDKPVREYYCKRDRWFTICEGCYTLCSSMCPQCKTDGGCNMSLVGSLNKTALQYMFADHANLSSMNPTMFVNVEESVIRVGITSIPTLGATRGSGPKLAEATATLNRGIGEVSLKPGDKFSAISIEMCSPEFLSEDASMIRTILKPNDTIDRHEVLGPALPWANALLYGTTSKFPTLVGHTDKNERIYIALACNPELPGFLLRSMNPKNKMTALSAVDIPASMADDFVPFTDPNIRKFVDPMTGELNLFKVDVTYDTSRQNPLVPDNVETVGDHVRETYVMKKGVQYGCRFRTLKATEVAVFSASLKKTVNGTEVVNTLCEYEGPIPSFWGHRLRCKFQFDNDDEFADTMYVHSNGVPVLEVHFLKK